MLVYPYTGWATFTTVDMLNSVYQRGDAITDILSESLVRLDKNFEVHPGAATEWSVDDSGLVWTFKLDPNLMWNDGTPVTAGDYVATFQYGADPTHAWDFTWYYDRRDQELDAGRGGRSAGRLEIGVTGRGRPTRSSLRP